MERCQPHACEEGEKCKIRWSSTNITTVKEEPCLFTGDVFHRCNLAWNHLSTHVCECGYDSHVMSVKMTKSERIERLEKKVETLTASLASTTRQLTDCQLSSAKIESRLNVVEMNSIEHELALRRITK